MKAKETDVRKYMKANIMDCFNRNGNLSSTIMAEDAATHFGENSDEEEIPERYFEIAVEICVAEDNKCRKNGTYINWP